MVNDSGTLRLARTLSICDCADVDTAGINGTGAAPGQRAGVGRRASTVWRTRRSCIAPPRARDGRCVGIDYVRRSRAEPVDAVAARWHAWTVLLAAVLRHPVLVPALDHVPVMRLPLARALLAWPDVPGSTIRSSSGPYGDLAMYLERLAAAKDIEAAGIGTSSDSDER